MQGRMERINQARTDGEDKLNNDKLRGETMQGRMERIN